MEQQLNKKIKGIKIIHIGILTGLLFFILISIFINQKEGGFIDNDKTLLNIFLIVANLFSLVSVIVGLIFFQKKIKNTESLNLNEKLDKYREAMIIRIATINGASFFLIIGFMLFGAYILLFEAFAGLALLLIFFPTNYRIAKEIKHDLREIV